MIAPYNREDVHATDLLSPYRASVSGAIQDRSFITVAQQIGAECPLLSDRLEKVLSEHDSTSAHWSQWDQELIQKVSRDIRIPAELIASVDVSGHSWIDDLLNGVVGRIDEMTVFFRIKETVRDLARTGHVILIGHGSTYMTRDLPGGLHIRLIAPMDCRAKHVAERFKLSPRAAARHMRRIDKQRQHFFRKFWPGVPLSPEIFAATLNTAELDEDRLLSAIVAMLPNSN